MVIIVIVDPACRTKSESSSSAPVAAPPHAAPATAPPPTLTATVLADGYALCDLEWNQWAPLACLDDGGNWVKGAECVAMATGSYVAWPIGKGNLDELTWRRDWDPDFAIERWQPRPGHSPLALGSDSHLSKIKLVTKRAPVGHVVVPVQRKPSVDEESAVRAAMVADFGKLTHDSRHQMPTTEAALGKVTVRVVADLDGDVILGGSANVSGNLSAQANELFARRNGTLVRLGDHHSADTKLVSAVTLGAHPLLVLEDDGEMSFGPSFLWTATWDGSALKRLGSVCCQKPPNYQCCDDIKDGVRTDADCP
jgi:hypothetical protein